MGGCVVNLLLNDQVAFERLYEPVRNKILRFVWLNSCCQCSVIQNALRDVGVVIGEPVHVTYLYRLGSGKWGPNTDHYSKTLKVEWKDLDTVL
jgi:uncharacterized protein YuzB (UPF0349 family)